MTARHLLRRLLGRAPAPHRVPVIMILAEARTGSNLLCDRLGHVPGHVSLFEVFNPDAVHGLRVLPGAHHALVPGAAPGSLGDDDPRLRAAMAADPPAAIAALADSAGQAGHMSLSYKVFPEQLGPRALRALVAARPALLVVLGRARIAAFASFRKAYAVGGWTDVDLSDVPVTATLPQLRHYWAGRDRRSRDLWVQAGRLGVPRLALDYDRDIDGDRAGDSADRILARAGLDLRMPADAPPTHLQRQRRPLADPFDAFSNGAALRAEVEAAGALDFALGSVVDDLPD